MPHDPYLQEPFVGSDGADSIVVFDSRLDSRANQRRIIDAGTPEARNRTTLKKNDETHA